MSTDWTDILTGMVKHDTEFGYRVSLSGDPDANAIVAALADRYRSLRGTRYTDLEALVGSKVTILRGGSGTYGHGSISAISGTLFEGSTGVAILPKGKRKNGYGLKGMAEKGQILDVLMGYNQEAVLADRVAAVRATFPTLERLTQDDLDALPNKGNSCTLAVFGTYPFMGESVPGTIWLCHSYMKGDDIVENVLFIDPAKGESEYGSCFGKDLLRLQVGKVVGYLPMSFGDAVELTNSADNHEQAQRLLLATLTV